MFLPISLAAALVGVGLAAVAALRPDTGIDGTLGAFLAVLGSVALAVAVGLLASARYPAGARGLLTWGAVLLATLTGLAAWFLMQDAVVVASVIACIALLLSGTEKQRTQL